MAQARGWLGPLVTQNVDRLHSRAGYKDVLELHGTTHRCWPATQLTSRGDSVPLHSAQTAKQPAAHPSA